MPYDHDGDTGTDASKSGSAVMWRLRRLSTALRRTTAALDTDQQSNRYTGIPLGHAERCGDGGRCQGRRTLTTFIADNAADNYNAFKARFGGLTDDQRTEVDRHCTPLMAIYSVACLADLTVAPDDGI